MPSVVNQKMMEEMTSEFKENPYTFVSSFDGVTVSDISDLRRNLEKCAKRSLVVKQAVAKKAFEGMELGDIAQFFKGSILVTLGQDEPQVISKALIDFSKKNKNFSPQGMVFEKQIYDAAYVKSLAALPSKKELLTAVVTRIQSPLSGFVMTLNQLVKGVAVAINEIKKKKEAAG